MKNTSVGMTGAAILFLVSVVDTAMGQVGPPPGWEIVGITDDPNWDGPPSMNNRGQIVFAKRAIPNPGGQLRGYLPLR